MVRCKFRCTQKVETQPGEFQIFFEAVTTGSPENENFFKWTPGGSLKMFTVSDHAAKTFEAGQEYYIDLTAAEEPEKSDMESILDEELVDPEDELEEVDDLVEESEETENE